MHEELTSYQETIKLIRNLLEVDTRNNLVNITKLSKANPTGREVKAWLRNKETTEKIKAMVIYGGIQLCTKIDINNLRNIENIIEVRIGGNGETGTWVCPELAIDFAEYSSLRFWYLCKDILLTVFKDGVVELTEEFWENHLLKYKKTCSSKGGLTASRNRLKKKNAILEEELYDIKTHWLKPKDLGKRIGVSATKINQILMNNGYQYKDKFWIPTELAEGMCYIEDKSTDIYSSYTLKWNPDIIEDLEF